jgi:hypothetical protein
VLIVGLAVLTSGARAPRAVEHGAAPVQGASPETPEKTDATPNSRDDQSPEDQGATAQSDTTETFPKKMPARKPWEYVVSAPGWVLYAPFWLVFQATGGVIKLQEEYKIGDRLMAFLTAADGSRGILPVYSSRSGLGVEYFQKNKPNEGARFNFTGSWGLLGRSLYQVRYRRVNLFGGALSSGGQLTFRNMPDEKFFGIGPNSLEQDETNYQIKVAVAEIGQGKWVRPKLVMGGIVGLNHNIPGPGKSDKSPSTTDVLPGLPGLDEEITVTRLTLGLYYNGKNRPARPSSGWEIETRARIDQQVNGDDFAYTTTFVDIMKYTRLFRDRTLFLRFGFRLSDPLSNRQIPFYQLSELGSDETIRGYQRGRFRDFDAALGTIEYRYPIWRTIDALLFVDAGQVQRDIFRDFTSSDIAWSYGGGFKVWKREGTLLRLELGKSDDGYRILFLLNPSGARRDFAYF